MRDDNGNSLAIVLLVLYFQMIGGWFIGKQIVEIFK